MPPKEKKMNTASTKTPSGIRKIPVIYKQERQALSSKIYKYLTKNAYRIRSLVGCVEKAKFLSTFAEHHQIPREKLKSPAFLYIIYKMIIGLGYHQDSTFVHCLSNEEEIILKSFENGQGSEKIGLDTHYSQEEINNIDDMCIGMMKSFGKHHPLEHNNVQ